MGGAPAAQGYRLGPGLAAGTSGASGGSIWRQDEGRDFAQAIGISCKSVVLETDCFQNVALIDKIRIAPPMRRVMDRSSVRICQEPPTRARLRLLATTDLHMHLTGFDYNLDRPDAFVGLTRVATLIRKARAEAADMAAGVLLFDNGDALQGTALADLADGQAAGPHPLMRALAALEYDAIGLGNHDFDFGLERLRDVLAQAPCPVIGSNVEAAEPGALGPVRRHVVLDRILPGAARVRVGVMSLLPPQTMQWNAHLLVGRVAVGDMLEAARRAVAALRRRGADLVIALAHGGLGGEEARAGMENPVIPLAGLEGIDAIVAGHTHLVFPGPHHPGVPEASGSVDHAAGTVHGVPVVMAGSAGSHLGLIDLELERNAGGRWTVAAARSELRPVARRSPEGATESVAEEDPGLMRLLRRDHEATRARLARPVGRIDRPLHSYFSFVAEDRAAALVAAAQAAALRPHLAGSLAQGLPVLSAAAPARSGGRAGPFAYTDIPAGEVSLRHVIGLCPHANTLRAVILTGAQIRDWLEHAAGLFNRVQPGRQGQDLIDPSFPGHDFDILHGLDWVVDPSRPRRFGHDGQLLDRDAGRIRALRHAGRPVRPDDRFVVALNSYRAAGGGHVRALEGAPRLSLPRLAIRDAVADYISGRLARDALEDALPAWRFAAMAGTTVTVPTGPGAMAHLHELEGTGIRIQGRDANGFLRLVVPL